MCPNMHFRAQFILIQIIFKAEKKKKPLLPFAVHDYAWHFNSTYSEKAGGQTNWQAGEWIMEKSLRHLDTNYPKINNKKKYRCWKLLTDRCKETIIREAMHCQWHAHWQVIHQREAEAFRKEDAIIKPQLDFYDGSVISLSHAKDASLPAVLLSSFHCFLSIDSYILYKILTTWENSRSRSLEKVWII